MDEHDRIAQDQEELEHEKAKLLSQAHLQKSTMVRLLEDRNFKMYVEQLQKQIDRRLVSLLQIPSGADDIIKKNYNAGEMAGLKLALDLPSVLITYAQTSIDSARINEVRNNGEETSSANSRDTDEPGLFEGFDDGDDDDLDGGRTIRRFAAP